MYGPYRVARSIFGTWNKAIAAAGFEPNPHKFARRYAAKDGHLCDSFAEKVIDDWLFEKGVEHLRNVPYPHSGKQRLTCDFVVADCFIEFFGLENEHVRYTELVHVKRELAAKTNLVLVELRPQYVFPKNLLAERLSFLLAKKQAA